MQSDKELIKSIRKKAKQKILYLPHAVRQMARPERMISTSEIRKVIEQGKIIEDYPDDVRGHSCLLMGKGDIGRTIHIVCSPKEDYLAIITAYIPSIEDWEDGFEERKK